MEDSEDTQGEAVAVAAATAVAATAAATAAAATAAATAAVLTEVAMVREAVGVEAGAAAGLAVLVAVTGSTQGTQHSQRMCTSVTMGQGGSVARSPSRLPPAPHGLVGCLVPSVPKETPVFWSKESVWGAFENSDQICVVPGPPHL